MENAEIAKKVTTSENIPEKEHSTTVNDEMNELNPAFEEQQDEYAVENYNQLKPDEKLIKKDGSGDMPGNVNENLNVISSSDKNTRTTTIANDSFADGKEKQETDAQKSIITIETVNANDKSVEYETTTTLLDKEPNTHIDNVNISFVGDDVDSKFVGNQPPFQPTSVSTVCCTSLNNSPTIRYSDLAEKQLLCDEIVKPLQQKQNDECALKLQQQMLQYEKQLEQLKAALQQKDNMITLFQRENAILEKEKEAVSL